MTRTTVEAGPADEVGLAAQRLMAAEDGDNRGEDVAQDQLESLLEGEELEADEVEPEESEEAEEPEEDDEEIDEADDEGDEDEEPEEDDEEPEEPEAEAEPKYKVKVDGEEFEVTLDELRNGYSRDADYRRKTQALAEQRKAVEAEVERARQEREQYAQRLEIVEQQLQETQGREPDWDKLYQEDPVEWVRQRELWRDKQQRLQAVKAERERLAQQQQQEQAQQLQAKLAQEQERLLEVIPEWKDSETARAEKQKIARVGQEYGYTNEELAQIYDHRAVAVLRDAARYRELMAKRKSLKPKRKQATKTASPGSTPTRSESQRSASAKRRKRVAKTGHVRDAAAAIESLLE